MKFICPECKSANFVQEGKKFYCKDCGYIIDLTNEKIIEVTKDGKTLWYQFAGVFESVKVKKGTQQSK